MDSNRYGNYKFLQSNRLWQAPFAICKFKLCTAKIVSEGLLERERQFSRRRQFSRLRCVIFRARLWLSVKVDVHINNGGFVGRPHPGNGHAARSEIARESSDHAYEQICVRQEETSSVSSSSRKKPVDNTSDSR